MRPVATAIAIMMMIRVTISKYVTVICYEHYEDDNIPFCYQRCYSIIIAFVITLLLLLLFGF